MWSQMSFRKHHYEQSYWRWWNSSWNHQILKDDAVKMLHSICQQIWKTQQWPHDWKMLISFRSQRKVMPKDVQTAAQLHLYHMLAKWYSKFSKPGFNSTWTMDFQMFKVDLEKAEEPEIKLPTSAGSSKKQEFQKDVYFCFVHYAKPLAVWITTN